MSADTATLADAPKKTVQRFVEAFNKVDADGMVACFAVPSFILDGMAPHVWSGPTAPADWLRDALAEAQHHGISDFHVSLDAPLHDVVTGDAAYFAAPATMSFKAQGRTITQPGAIMTLAMRRVDGGWLISAWAWTKGTGAGVDDVARSA